MTEKDIRKIIRESINKLDESRMVTFTSEILSKIGKVDGMKTLDIQSTGSGSIGLYRYKDGNAYEIEIKPAALIKYKERWGALLKKKEEHPIKPFYRMLNKNGK